MTNNLLNRSDGKLISNEVSQIEKRASLLSDFYLSDQALAFSPIAFHSDLVWIEGMVKIMGSIDPYSYSLDYYFHSFANLLHNQEFDPDSGLFDIVFGLQYTRQQFRYSAHIECLLSAIEDLKFETNVATQRVSSPVLGTQTLDLWNALIKEVWARITSLTFIKRCVQDKRRAARRKVVMESYVLKVLEKYKRLLVLRVDFGYLSEHAPYISEQRARADLARLFANRRHNKELLPDLVGYVACIEWAENTRYHFHVLFMLDGDRRRNDAYLAQEVGLYWVNVITNGRGRFYNCNFAKHKYDSCGLGMIHLKNPDQVDSLLRSALGYLLNKERYLIAKSLEHSKSVFRALLP